MADMNMFTLTGTVVSDAVVKSVGARGTQLTEFSIQNHTGNGRYARQQTFRVLSWGAQGAGLAQSLLAGAYVGVMGALELNTYTTRSGQVVDSWQITASAITVFPSYMPPDDLDPKEKAAGTNAEGFPDDFPF